MDFQVDWAYSWTIAGVSILTVFVLLVVLIIVIRLQGSVMNLLARSGKKKVEAAPVVEEKQEEGTPSEAEMAAIAMALELHYNSHDEVPEMLEIKTGQGAISPWCARNLGMNRLK